MKLFVAGCHGGETIHHRTSGFVLDGRLAIDAGSLTSGLTLAQQGKLEAVLVSHAHMDHIRDLATISDNRAQMERPPLDVIGTRETLAALKRHFFNDLLWPDFTKIPSRTKPAIRLVTIPLLREVDVHGYRVRAVPVTHTVDSSGFIIRDKTGASVVYSGDTGPTEKLWEMIDKTPKVVALMMEVSFPSNYHALAMSSGHHTPETLERDLKKLEKNRQIPVLLYHMKPLFQPALERECGKIRGYDLTPLKIGDEFSIR